MVFTKVCYISGILKVTVSIAKIYITTSFFFLPSDYQVLKNSSKSLQYMMIIMSIFSRILNGRFLYCDDNTVQICKKYNFILFSETYQFPCYIRFNTDNLEKNQQNYPIYLAVRWGFHLSRMTPNN